MSKDWSFPPPIPDFGDDVENDLFAELEKLLDKANGSELYCKCEDDIKEVVRRGFNRITYDYCKTCKKEHKNEA